MRAINNYLYNLNLFNIALYFYSYFPIVVIVLNLTEKTSIS